MGNDGLMTVFCNKIWNLSERHWGLAIRCSLVKIKTFISFRGAVVKINDFSDRSAELEEIKCCHQCAFLECILY